MINHTAMNSATRAASAFHTLAQNSRCLNAIGRNKATYYNQYDLAHERLGQMESNYQ